MSKIMRAPDYAKCFGILLVVFGHTLRGLFSSEIVEKNEFWSSVDAVIYLFHMPLFFYLSGLFIEKSSEYKAWKDLLKHSFVVLIIPMIFWSYLQFSLQYFASSYSNTEINLSYVLTAPFPPRQQFWFLAVLFLMLVTTSFLLQRQILQKILLPLTFFGFVAQAIFWDSAFIYMHDHPVLYILILMLLYWPYFLLGMLFSGDSLKKIRIPTLLCTLIFIGSLISYHVIAEMRVLLSILCVLAIYKITLNIDEAAIDRNIISRVAVFIGINSMIIYLAHIIFSAGLRTVLLRMGIDDPTTHLIGGFIAGVIFPLGLIPIGLMMAKKMPNFVQAIIPVRLKRL